MTSIAYDFASINRNLRKLQGRLDREEKPAPQFVPKVSNGKASSIAPDLSPSAIALAICLMLPVGAWADDLEIAYSLCQDHWVRDGMLGTFHYDAHGWAEPCHIIADRTLAATAKRDADAERLRDEKTSKDLEFVIGVVQK